MPNLCCNIHSRNLSLYTSSETLLHGDFQAHLFFSSNLVEENKKSLLYFLYLSTTVSLLIQQIFIK